jgi:DNA polymerase III subunit epsilon
MNMREIVLDTETTGLDPASGDRVVEIGGIELFNRFPTRNSFHIYLNPECVMSAEAEQVHGLSLAFLADKPRFRECVDEFMAFLGDAKLVIHNASFDIGFLNAELARTGHESIRAERVVDTIALARRKHPGAANSLDALCSRYGIDNSSRTKHGALLDAELLAEVYIELTGGRQTGLAFESAALVEVATSPVVKRPAVQRMTVLPSLLSDEACTRHAALVESLGEKAIWRRYLGDAGSHRSTVEAARQTA